MTRLSPRHCHTLVPKFAFLLLSATIVMTGCKPRRASQLSQDRSELSLEDAEEKLRRLEITLAGYLEYAESESVHKSNQWFAPHIYAHLSAAEKSRLGDPQVASAQNSIALLDGPPATNTEADAKIRQLNEEIATLRAYAAAERARILENEKAISEFSQCKIGGTSDYTGCFCFNRWKFGDTFPLKEPGQNPCIGKYGDFCGHGFAFQVPSPRLHASLLTFPTPPDTTPVPREDLIFFLEKDYNYRACRELAGFDINGDATILKDKMGKRLGDWVNKQESSALPVTTQKPGEKNCAQFRRQTNEVAAVRGRGYWATGQCIPLAGYNQTPPVSNDSGPASKPIRDDISQFIPQSDINRFRTWANKKEPFARLYCARDWVVSSRSSDPNVNYGSLTEIGTTFAMVDVSLSTPEGSYDNVAGAIKTAKGSVDRRWLNECKAAALYYMNHPIGALKPAQYPWSCDGEAHWEDALSVGESQAPAANRASTPKGMYCSFYNELYEDVRRCEISKGSDGGDACCEMTMKERFKFESSNERDKLAKAFCAGFERKLPFKGLDALDQELSCATRYQNWLLSPNSETLKKDFEELCLVKGRTLKDEENPLKMSQANLLLARQSSVLGVVEVEKQRSRLSRDWFRAVALKPQRDCDRVGVINGIERFIPCHELFPPAGSRRQIPGMVGCYEDESLPDQCNGDPLAECVDAEEFIKLTAPSGPSTPAAKPVGASVPADTKLMLWACVDRRTKTKGLTLCSCEATRKMRLFR